MAEIKLVAPRVRVIREGQDTLEIQTDNRDLLAWEQTAMKHKWGSFQDRPFKWLTFLSWSAARRTGDLNGLTYEAWESQVLSVSDMSAEDDDDETGTPTGPGPDPG
jgi:hypothetical protein